MVVQKFQIFMGTLYIYIYDINRCEKNSQIVNNFTNLFPRASETKIGYVLIRQL